MRKYKQNVDRVTFDFPLGKRAMTQDGFLAHALADKINKGEHYHCTLPENSDAVTFAFFFEGKKVRVDSMLMTIEYSASRPEFVEREKKPKGGDND